MQWLLVRLGTVVLLEQLMQQQLNRLEKRVYAVWRMVRENTKATEADPLVDQLRDLVAQRNKIQAIRLARQRLGLSLREAKDYVDSL